MRCKYPWPLEVVRFVENSLSFNQLNVLRADIPCVLENTVGEAARSQPITLYVTIHITTLSRPDKAVERIDPIPIDPSNAWEGAVGRTKQLMDTLNQNEEVRVMSF